MILHLQRGIHNPDTALQKLKHVMRTNVSQIANRNLGSFIPITMKTAITLSLLPSRPTMPFVLGPDLNEGFRVAAELGFDAVEIFPPTLESIDISTVNQLCRQHSLQVSTIGTGGGAVAQGLTLTDIDPEIRNRAGEYIRGIIEIAGDFGGSAIIGSMQGRSGDRDKPEVLKWLGDALADLGEYAKRWDQPLFYEPLNRYETNLVNRLEQAAALIETHDAGNAKILADLFHMNIEETDIADSIQNAAAHIGHVHFVDSNRWPAGYGHTDMGAAFQALRQFGFTGYLAVEAFPLPDQLTAAKKSAEAFSQLTLA